MPPRRRHRRSTATCRPEHRHTAHSQPLSQARRATRALVLSRPAPCPRIARYRPDGAGGPALRANDARDPGPPCRTSCQRPGHNRPCGDRCLPGAQHAVAPAPLHSRSRGQTVTPLQPICSAGTSAQVTLLPGTWTIPRMAARSSTGNRPGYRRRGGQKGSNGAMRSRRSSSTRSFAIGEVCPSPRHDRSPTNSCRNAHYSASAASLFYSSMLTTRASLQESSPCRTTIGRSRASRHREPERCPARQPALLMTA